MQSITIRNTVIGEGLPKIIVPLMAAGEKELLEEIEAVNRLRPDIIEWRADVYEHVDSLDAVKDMLEMSRKAAGATPSLSHSELIKKAEIKLLMTAFTLNCLKPPSKQNTLTLQTLSCLREKRKSNQL